MGGFIKALSETPPVIPRFLESHLSSTFPLWDNGLIRFTVKLDRVMTFLPPSDRLKPFLPF
jgi:hypothetical protein